MKIMLKPRSKKLLAWTVAIVLILMLIVLPIMHFVRDFQASMHDMSRYQVKSFWKYRRDFTTLAEYFGNRFQPELLEDVRLRGVRIGLSGEQIKIEKQFYNESQEENITLLEDMNEEMRTCFEAVKEALPPDSRGYSSFAYIYVTRTQVAFTTYLGPYSVVYSKDCRPTCVVSEENPAEFVQWICPNWYHVMTR